MDTFDLMVLPDTLTTTLAVIIILALTVIVAKSVRVILDKFFKKSSDFLKLDPTRYNFLKHVMSGTIYVIGFGLAIYMIPALRVLSVSIFAGAGILAAILGFASQQAFSNIVSGVFIVIFKPFRVGDRIEVGGKHIGIVEDISIRHTVIRNFENKRIVIPNAIISSEVIVNANLVDDRVCNFLDIGISYDSDVDKAMAIITEEAEKHQSILDVRTPEDLDAGQPMVPVRLVSFGDSSVNLRANLWSFTPVSHQMACDLRKSIKERFDKEGIEIPYPYRTLIVKNSRAQDHENLPIIKDK